LPVSGSPHPEPVLPMPTVQLGTRYSVLLTLLPARPPQALQQPLALLR
jgi:hypothetical protein